MEAPKCRLCGDRHWGGCAFAPQRHSAVMVRRERKVVEVPKRPDGFDRKLYQREYMREYMRLRRAAIARGEV